jgi:tape measure domain-containing protein
VELFRLFGVVDVQGNMALQQLRDINGEAKRGEGLLATLAKQAVGVAGGFALWNAAKNAVRGLSGLFFELGGRFDRANIAFTTMLGSSERAQRHLEELEQFAARTPFQFPDLMEASQLMQALGFQAEEVVPKLTAIGNAAAALGRGKEWINSVVMALGRMNAMGRVGAEEMRRLVEGGVPAWELLAEAIGKSTAEVMKLSEQGLIPADRAIQALINGMERRYPRMMDKLSDTFEGATSTIRDNLQMLFKDMTKNVFVTLTESARRVRDWTIELQAAFKERGLQGFYEFLVPPDVRNRLTPLVEAFSTAWRDLVQGAQAMLPVLTDVAKTALGVLAPVGTLLLEGAAAAGRFARTVAEDWPRIKPWVTGLLAAFLAYSGAVAVLNATSNALAAFNAGALMLPRATGMVSRLGMAVMELRTAPNAFRGLVTAMSMVTGMTPAMMAFVAAVGAIAGAVAWLALQKERLARAAREARQALEEASSTAVEAAESFRRQVVQVEALGDEYARLHESMDDLDPEERARVLERLAQIEQSLTTALGAEAVKRILASETLQAALEDEIQAFTARARVAEQAARDALQAQAEGLRAEMRTSQERIEVLKREAETFDSALEHRLHYYRALAAEAERMAGDLPDAQAEAERARERVRQLEAQMERQRKITAEIATQQALMRERELDLARVLENLARLETGVADASGAVVTAVAQTWEPTAREIDNAFREALKAVEAALKAAQGRIGEGTELATLQVKHAIEAAVIAIQALGPAGGETARQLQGHLTRAAEQVRAAVYGKSEVAGQALLQHLGDAARFAGRQIEDEFGETAQSITASLAEAAQMVEDRFHELAEEVRRQQMRGLDDLHSAVIGALRRRYSEEQTQQTDAIRRTLNAEKARTDAVVQEINRERRAREEATTDALRLRIRGIWDEIDALDALTRQEEEAARAAEEQRRLAELRAQMEEVLDPRERQRLQAEMARQEQEIERRKTLTQREERKRALADELEDIRFQQEERYRQFEEARRRELEFLEQVFYPQRLRDQALYAEAERMILLKQHADMLQVLETHGDGWRDLGKSFGQRLLDGFGPYLTELGAMVQNVLGAIQGLQLTPMPAAGFPVETRIPRMHTGGPVGGAGELFKRLFALKPREVPVILEQGELVLPRQFRLPEVRMPEPAGRLAGLGDITVNLNNCTFLDGRDAGQQIGAGLFTEMRRRGM